MTKNLKAITPKFNYKTNAWSEAYRLVFRWADVLCYMTEEGTLDENASEVSLLPGDTKEEAIETAERMMADGEVDWIHVQQKTARGWVSVFELSNNDYARGGYKGD